MFLEIAIAVSMAASESTGAKICDPQRYVSRIAPDMQYTEDSFTYETFRQAVDWLREADWMKRPEEKSYAHPIEFGWEFEMAYFNRLTAIEGYALKLGALASAGSDKDVAVDRFCTFVINAVPLD